MGKNWLRFIKSKKNHEPQVAYKAASMKTKSKGMYRKSFNTNEAIDLSEMVLLRKKNGLKRWGVRLIQERVMRRNVREEGRVLDIYILHIKSWPFIKSTTQIILNTSNMP
jgi:hypothetical protein